MKQLELLAFDIGAGNGRAMLGSFDGERLRLHEQYRFYNNYVKAGEADCGLTGQPAGNAGPDKLFPSL